MKDLDKVVRAVKGLVDSGRQTNIKSSIVYKALDGEISSRKIGEHLRRLKERKMLVKEGGSQTSYSIKNHAWSGSLEDVLEKAEIDKTKYFEKSYIVDEPILRVY